MRVTLDLNDTVVKIGRAFNTRRNIVSYRNDVKRHNVAPLEYFLHLHTENFRKFEILSISASNPRI
jgi:hypothetical protein